ncbi:hypothetical protein VW23_025255 [Devosia insulae DS-56]|uniref:DUF6161 domain-containing protein n=1 Tax=Devosia insulae DS-56 TaxID=1116389 RepID=A0A1E5XLP4_9HYPH|nr:DUF6161 domain-containing protein [Devosia insulae]OEO29520.1 hypothetical protein VW23_025255 [Devosia insulae DS-56]
MAKPSSAEAKGDQFPVTLSAPAQGFRRSFKNAQEVHNFLSEEVRFWSDLASRADGVAFQSAGKPLLNVSGQQAAHRAFDSTNQQPSAANAAAALRELLDSGSILSAGKQGKLLAKLSEDVPPSTPYVAVGLAAELQPAIVQGIGQARIYTTDFAAAMAGLSAAKGSGAERHQLDSLLAEVSGLKSELEHAKLDFNEWRSSEEARWSNAVAEFAASHAKTTETTSDGIGAFLHKAAEKVDAAVRTSEQRVSEFLRTSTEETEKFKKQVRQNVVNEVPTTFWNAKAEGHRNVAAGAALAFLLVAGIGVYILSTQGVPLVASAFHTIGGDQSESALLALVPLAFITIPALAFAWVLRHISRVLVQNLSLGADARLRGTITSTFRALAADRPMSEAELAIALQALFRPLEAKDHAEISPPNLADLLKLDK